MSNPSQDKNAVVLAEYKNVIGIPINKVICFETQKQDNGLYDTYYFDDCSFDDMSDLLQIEFLKSCGCGDPDDNVKFVYNILKAFRDIQDYDEKTKVLNELGLNNSQVKACILYFLNSDNIALLEHGGSIYGSWLSENGKTFMKLYEQFVVPEQQYYKE